MRHRLGAQIEEIATSAILETSFPLRQPDPMEETEVFVNGQPVEDGWYYDEQTNSVIFDYEDVLNPEILFKLCTLIGVVLLNNVRFL